jgi:outer membrane protein assembly factor BamB
MKRLVSVGILLCFASFASAQNWTAFRGNNASGIAEGKPTPVAWDGTKNENILWKVAIPGLAHSSPVVWGDKVFVTTAISSDPKTEFRAGLYGDVDSAKDVSKHTWKVYCFDKRTGKISWEQVAHEGIPRTKRHIKSTYANSTPATDGKYLIVFFGSEGLYCYDLAGKQIWKKDLGVLNGGWFYDPDYEWGTASSPIIYKGMVILQCDVQKDSFVAAFDIKTGKELWRTPREEIPSWGTPTIYEGKTRAELITNATQAIRSYDPMTGKELWHMTGNPEVTATTPIIANDLIYIVNHYRPNQPIWVIRPGGTGDISLKRDPNTKQFTESSNQYVVWSAQRGGAYMPSPLVYGDYLYICQNQAILRCLNAKTGEKVYENRIGEGGSYSASPVAADGKVYLSSEDGAVFVIKAGAKYEMLAKNEMGEVLMATPAISDGMIFVRGQHNLFCIADKGATKAGADKATKTK